MVTFVTENPTALARTLWQAIEPLHTCVYFAPGPAQAAREAGLKGYWMGYFAGRFGPLGPVGPEVVTALAYNFAPDMVARAVPDAWRYADPAEVLPSRSAAAAEVVRHAAGEVFDGPDALTQLAELADLLWAAIAACDFGGRALGAAWSAQPRPDEPAEAVWLGAGILREHRGDGHVAAAVAEDLSGLEAVITFVATGAIEREVIAAHRGWTEQQWDEAAGALRGRGLLDAASRLTRAGQALRDAVEHRTDVLAAAPVEVLGPAAVLRAVELAVPVTRRLIDAGIVPVPNPVGVPRP